MTNKTFDERLVSVADCAERLDVGRTTINKMIQTGTLASVKIGRSRKVRLSSLLAITERGADLTQAAA